MIAASAAATASASAALSPHFSRRAPARNSRYELRIFFSFLSFIEKEKEKEKERERKEREREEREERERDHGRERVNEETEHSQHGDKMGTRQSEVKLAVVVGFAEGRMMDIITGRAPPSHEPTDNNPRQEREEF